MVVSSPEVMRGAAGQLPPCRNRASEQDVANIPSPYIYIYFQG